MLHCQHQQFRQANAEFVKTLYSESGFYIKFRNTLVTEK